MNRLRDLLIVVLLGSCPWSIQGQFTAIPDPIFEQFLISESLDDVLDGQVLTASISDEIFLQINETDPIFPIEDLTGIQDFTSLESLIIAVTSTTAIDFGNLTDLTSLDLIMNTSLEQIDISGCPNLEELRVSGNNLNTLDVSQNLNLRILTSSNNNLTNTIDVSQHPNLTFFSVANNILLGIDFRNGTNENIEFFNATGNPNLNCIFVDDAEFSTANWTNIDPATTFVETEEECAALSLEDVNALAVNIYPNPASRFFEIDTNQEIVQISLIDLNGRVIQSFAQGLDNYSITDVSEGFYLLHIQTDVGTVTQKLIVKK